MSAKRRTVEMSDRVWMPELVGQHVEVERAGDGEYRVFLNGEQVGTVSRYHETWERRSRGARYVNARGTARRASWQHSKESPGLSQPTISDAAHDLARLVLRERNR